MSYQPVDWVTDMLQERWGRLVEDKVGGAPSAWSHNNRPRDLANEYIALADWTQRLERELERSNAILEELNTRLTGASDGLGQQVDKNQQVLSGGPSTNSKS